MRLISCIRPISTHSFIHLIYVIHQIHLRFNKPLHIRFVIKNRNTKYTCHIRAYVIAPKNYIHTM